MQHFNHHSFSTQESPSFLGILATGWPGVLSMRRGQKREIPADFSAFLSRQKSSNSQSISPRALVVGWDGADPRWIERFIAEGKLPAMAQLTSRGSLGLLASVQPLLSPCVWTSIATGVRPHEHGVLGFVQNGRVVRGSDREKPAFWDAAVKAGKKTQVIGWWPSHPAYSVGMDGFMVSDLHSVEGLADQSVFPSQERDVLDFLRVSPQDLGVDVLAPFLEPVAQRIPEVRQENHPLQSAVAHAVAAALTIQAYATYAMASRLWDLHAVYFNALDPLQHLSVAYPELVEPAYRFHDMLLEALLDQAGESVHVCVVSDHGFKASSELQEKSPHPAQDHAPYGVIVAAGPQWEGPQRLYGASVLDIAPTVCSVLGVPWVDCSGVPLNELWKSGTAPVVQKIESIPPIWKSDTSLAQNENQSWERLVSMGYLEPDALSTDSLSYTRKHTLYNECLSRLAVGEWFTVGQKITEGLVEFPQDQRLLHLRASVAFQCHDTSVGLDGLQGVGRTLFEALWGLREGQWEQALVLLRCLQQEQPLSDEWRWLVVRSLRQASQWNEHRVWVEEYLSQCPEWPQPSADWQLEAGYAAAAQGNFSEALDWAVRASQQQHKNIEIHKAIAQWADRVSLSEVATQAIAVVHLLQEQTKPSHSPVVLVVGHPRSGTSLVMQCLERMKIPLQTDGHRTPDEHNPKGYFEFDPVKKSLLDTSWLTTCFGKAVKVVTPLVPSLPQQISYRVVWIRRPLPEVVLSQEILRGRRKEEVLRHMPFGLFQQLEKEDKALAQWLDHLPQENVCLIDFHRLIQNPQQTIEELAKFLQCPIPQEGTSGWVDVALVRNTLSL